MVSIINENIYDMTLISNIKERTGSKKLKNIMKNLRNFAEDDVKGFSGLKVKKFEEKTEEVKKPEHKKMSISILNNDDEEENTPIIYDNEQEVKQICYCDSSADE